jgi:enoyl-CoA hydratase/carnithine racemase
VEPDLVAAHLLWRTPGRSELVKRLVTSETIARRPAYHAQLINALAPAVDDYEPIAKDLKAHLAASMSALFGAGATTAASLTGLLVERLHALVDAALDAAADQDLSAARQLATALALPAHGSDYLINHNASDLLYRLPYPHPGLTDLGVALARRALVHAEFGTDTGLLASTAGTLGNWLGDHGQRTEALSTMQRVVGCGTTALVRGVLGVELLVGIAWCGKSIELFSELEAEEPGAFATELAAIEAFRSKLTASCAS